MNPKKAFENRTARLLAEGSHKPRVAYISETGVISAAQLLARRELIKAARKLAITEDFCHICGRCTDHFADHDNEQILAWAAKPGMLQGLLK